MKKAAKASKAAPKPVRKAVSPDKPEKVFRPVQKPRPLGTIE